MGSPTGIASGDCDLAPPTLLEDSATLEGAVEAGALSSSTRLFLDKGPGLKSEAKISGSKNQE